MAEDPTVETPKEQPKVVKEEWTQEKIDGIISELDAANVSTPEEVRGKLEASKQAGQTANLLGEARKELSGLRDEMALLRQSQAAPDTSFDEFAPAPPVDIEKTVISAIRKEKDLERQYATQYQSAVNAQWNAIVSDRDYVHVKPVWEKKLQDPNFVYQINAGLVNPTQAYNDTVRDFYKGLSKRAGAAMKLMQGNTPGKAPLNLETNQVPVGIQTTTPESTEKIKQLQEDVNTGKILTDDQELAALDALLGQEPL